ncbi:MAG: hypothetical protein QJR03_15640 [Sphaerobacter sp.]|nr:hypothetical protein [Sphaerobacter sp.]
MYARMMQALIKPDQLATAARLCREGVLPAVRLEPGFKGMIVLTDPGTAKGLTLTLWTTEAAMYAGESSANLEPHLERLAEALAAPPTRESLIVRALDAPRPTAMRARVISYQVNPSVLDDFVIIFRDEVLPAARRERGFSTGLLLISPATARAVSFTLWDSEADLEGGQISGDLRDRLSHLSRLLLTPPVREVFHVDVLEILP